MKLPTIRYHHQQNVGFFSWPRCCFFFACFIFLQHGQKGDCKSIRFFLFFFYELQLHAENVLNLAKRPVQSTSSEMFPCIRFAYVGRKQKKRSGEKMHRLLLAIIRCWLGWLGNVVTWKRTAIAKRCSFNNSHPPLLFLLCMLCFCVLCIQPAAATT